jgi:hypothetical protein
LLLHPKTYDNRRRVVSDTADCEEDRHNEQQDRTDDRENERDENLKLMN